MSYEGYNEHICASGHRFENDAYDDDMYWDEESQLSSKPVCHTCKAKSVWNNAVDQTNDEGFPYNNYTQITPDEYETCEHCNNSKLIKEATYQVPTEAEMEQYSKDREKFYDDLYEL